MTQIYTVNEIKASMGYLRPYLNEMLEKHPQGREFEEVRFLARHTGSYRPDKDVVPKEEADPKETPIGKITKKILPPIGFMLGLGKFDAGGGFRLSFGGVDDRYVGAYGRSTRHSPDKDFKSLKDKLIVLIEALDKSEDSQWLATYMIEEGASRCDLALEMFKDYLKGCKN